MIDYIHLRMLFKNSIFIFYLFIIGCYIFKGIVILKRVGIDFKDLLFIYLYFLFALLFVCIYIVNLSIIFNNLYLFIIGCKI